MPQISIAEAEFSERLVANRYKVKMPRHLAQHERWDVWERARFESMESLLHQGDVLFDIGAETGEISAIYAQFVGASRLFLVEPAPENWQTIKATWEANGLTPPFGTFCGLASDKSHVPEHCSFPLGYRDGWPVVAFTDAVWTDRTFRYLHEHTHETPQIKIDELVLHGASVGAFPKALTIDVEGAEFSVLKGAHAYLLAGRPLVWVSIHPDLIEKNYGHRPEDIHGFMEALGYSAELLAIDHEEHFLYRPKER